MLMTRIYKPALLKRVFELGCHYTGHVLFYQKMLGQLQDAGNVSTLSHYLELLSGEGLVIGLQKFSPDRLRQKSSSPKFQELIAKVGDGAYEEAAFSSLAMRFPTIKNVPPKMTFGN